MNIVKLIFLMFITSTYSFTQDTVRQTSFEGDSLEWKIKGIGSGILSDSFYYYAGDTSRGYEDIGPKLSRVYDGARSWQVNDITDTILFEPTVISGYSKVQFCFRFSATSFNLGQGLDVNDSIQVFIANTNSGFDSIPTLVIHGDNNTNWGFDADSIIKVNADSHYVFTVPEGELDTSNTSSTAKILIPQSFGDTIYIMMIVKNNQNKEVWNIDQVLLTGKKAVPLAIHLASFDVQKQADHTVQVKWQSWTESQCIQYVVQKSMNTITIASIDSFPCKNSDVLAEYSTVDKNPGLGRVYYRLKMIHNHSIEYTDWVSVLMNENLVNRVYPTVVNNHVFISTYADHNRYTIIDLFGKIVQSGSLHSKALHQVNVNFIHAGVYKIILSDYKSRVAYTIIKT